MNKGLRRYYALILLALTLVTTPALAKKSHQTAPDSALIEQGSYVNADGERIHRPAHTKNNQVPEGATARCRDGSYSFSRHHRGTCSHHGGVAEWLDQE